jgi:hypothetical protein
LFRLGFDESHTVDFISHVGRGTKHAAYLLSARLIVIDKVSVLTPWVAGRVSRTLGSIVEGNDGDWDFGGQLLFVGDLLQLPPVVKNKALPVSRRMITRLVCWPHIQKFSLREQHRSENLQWSNFLAQVATGSAEDIQF